LPLAPDSAKSEKAEPSLVPMYEAVQRLDSGNGTPEDVRISINTLAEHSIFKINQDPTLHWGRGGSDELHDALKLREMREGGHFGLMAHCADTINVY